MSKAQKKGQRKSAKRVQQSMPKREATSAGKSAQPKTFADFKADATNWITLATGEYYPDIPKDACELYKPVLVLFGQLLKTSESSIRLFMQMAEQSDGWMRTQLARVFRKYVSPETPVEMLKQKSKCSASAISLGEDSDPSTKFRPPSHLGPFRMRRCVPSCGNTKTEARRAMT
jgi:hypothetical protein